MQKVSNIKTTVQLATGNNNLTTTDNCTTVEVDTLLADCSDLISPTFTKWYARQFYGLQPSKVLELASLARADGKDAPRYFSHLIKRYASSTSA